MFTSEDKAKAFFADLVEKRPEIRKTMGDHLATVSLKAYHGTRTDPNKRGHFDFHEFENIDLSAVVNVEGAL